MPKDENGGYQRVLNKAQIGLFETRVLQNPVVYDHIPNILTVGYPFSRRSQI